MEFTTNEQLSEQEIRYLRKQASAAEPFGPGELRVVDGAISAAYAARMSATTARNILERHGISLVE